MLRRAITLSLLLTSVLTWIGCAATTHAAEALDVSALFRGAMASLRTAASYARTGNVALAQIEIDDARSDWHRLDQHADQVWSYPDQALHELLVRGDAGLASAADALAAGDTARAGTEILSLRRAIHALRREAGVDDLSGCVFELAPIMEGLRTAATRFSTTKSDPDRVKKSGEALRERLQRCNVLAPSEVAGEAEFRRLLDGAIASAGEIGSAALKGDADLVHRYQIELQSFISLLDFRFG